jgi:nucleoside-diphosphate-sugar epimerase
MSTVLVLGGTAWLSGLTARHAVERGHDVTCLARGSSGSVPDGVSWVRADRAEPTAYDEVAGRDWDLVVDVSWQPALVRSALAALGDRAGHWAYVSSISVYADGLEAGSDESAALFEPFTGDGPAGFEDYPGAKVACEQACRSAIDSSRLLIARAGLLVGHGDRSDRFGYWPARMALAADGEPVLVPPREQPLQVLDASDLASWLVEAGTDRRAGMVNAVGETGTVGDALEASAAAAGTAPDLREASEEWLLEHEVNPWMGPGSLPLWLPAEDAGAMAVDRSAAVRLGLTTRPLADTAAGSLEWERELGLDRERHTGLTRDRERELLALR